METDLDARLTALEAKLEAIHISTEKTRKYFLTTIWVSVILFVVPLILFVIAVPMVMSTYLSGFEGLI